MMNIQKNKVITSLLVILMLASAGLMASTVNTKAQTSNAFQSYCFIAVNPNPIGVNQQALVDFWMADVTAGSIGDSGNLYSGVTVIVTSPDGSKETRGPFTLNSLATGFFDYYPTTVGNYTFQMIYPGQTFASIHSTFSATKSAIVSLVVNTQQIASSYPQTPLPTSYWSRPINGQNYLWSAVSGNWLMCAWNQTGSGMSSSRAFDDGSSYAGEGVSPDSAHILWTSPLAAGGLAGGLYGSVPYYQGASYEQYFTPPVIANGILYYNAIVGNEPAATGIIAVSLQTGKALFTIANVSLTFGEIYNYVSPNQGGAFPYLWSVSGSTWKMYDATTGGWILTLIGVPSGVAIPSSDGSVLVYSLTANPNGYALSLWNSTRAMSIDNNHNPGQSNNYWTWRPYTWQTGPSKGIINATGTTMDSTGVQDTNGTMWTVQESNPVPGAVYSAFGWSPGLSIAPVFNQGGWFEGNNIVAAAIPGGIMNAFMGITWNTSSTDPVYIAAYNMATGAPAYTSVLRPPTGLPNDFGATIEETYEFNGIYYLFIKQTMQWAAWDIKTGGQPIWVSTPYTNAWGTYAQSGGEMQANGIFYAAGWDGEIHAYNVKTGAQIFDFSAANAGYNTPYGVYPFYGGITVTADGKIFAQTGQHGNGVATLYQGQALYVVNSTSGKSLWNMSGWFNYGALADGVWVTQNNYDNLIYAFGKGPSATTVESTLNAVSLGSSVVVQGKVTDQSPGAKDTPAISDGSMSAWMAYLYEQQPMPTSATGVKVHLTALDPNNNIEDLGIVTSDKTGLFSAIFSPPVEGKYTIIATFEGSNSYYGSSAETTVGVVHSAAAAVVTPTPVVTTPTVAPTSTQTQTASPSPSQATAPASGIPMMTYIAIAAAVVIIIVIAAAIALRRRK
jgi:hypothetical protein